MRFREATVRAQVYSARHGAPPRTKIQKTQLGDQSNDHTVSRLRRIACICAEQKEAGIIVDYKVYTTPPRSPDEPNIYLVTTYKNMAAMDGLADKTEAMTQKMYGDVSQRSKAAIDREKMRTQIGSQMTREQILK